MRFRALLALACAIIVTTAVGEARAAFVTALATATYTEVAPGPQDINADTLVITNSSEPGVYISSITITLPNKGTGIGQIIFDTAAGAPGTDPAIAPNIVSVVNGGNPIAPSFTLNDGDTFVTVSFGSLGFGPGDQIRFDFDVDSSLGANDNQRRQVPGVEFGIPFPPAVTPPNGAGFSVTFSGPLIADTVFSGTFVELGTGSSQAAASAGGEIFAVPEPSSILLSGMGLVGLCGVARRRKKAAPNTTV